MYKKNKIMRKIILLILLVLLLPNLSFASFGDKKVETIAILSFFLLAVGFILLYYFKWKTKKDTPVEAPAVRYKVKQIQMIQNGRKVIVTKKIRIVDDNSAEARPLDS